MIIKAVFYLRHYTVIPVRVQARMKRPAIVAGKNPARDMNMIHLLFEINLIMLDIESAGILLKYQ
jgi:hypothetical protein